MDNAQTQTTTRRRPGSASAEITADPAASQTSPVAEGGATGPLPPVLEGSLPPGAKELQPMSTEPSEAVHRVERLEQRLDGFVGEVGRQLGQVMHVLDRLAQAQASGGTDPLDANAPEKRVRPDSYLASVANEVSTEELLRMLELKGQEEEVAKLRAEGISPSTHWIAADCMAIGILNADGEPVQTKVMPGEPIPRERLSAATLEWGLKHPEGAKFVRPGEYRAPKPTHPATR